MGKDSRSVFRFKQFEVDQTGCAMKINTDGVLLGALTTADDAATILDIGTGTGVIALMLAQRYANAQIDAVELDTIAAQTAAGNFANAPFADRLTAYAMGFAEYFEQHPGRKYDLIVSNPPFYINALTSPGEKKNMAKHADGDFFNALISNVSQHLTEAGRCALILPVSTAELVKNIAKQNALYLQKSILVHSFNDDEPHREIVVFGLDDRLLQREKFIIYSAPKVYSQEYSQALKDFFTIF